MLFIVVARIQWDRNIIYNIKNISFLFYAYEYFLAWMCVCAKGMSDVWGLHNKTPDLLKLYLHMVINHLLSARNWICVLRNDIKSYLKKIESKSVIYHERDAEPIRCIADMMAYTVESKFFPPTSLPFMQSSSSMMICKSLLAVYK